MVDTPFVPNLSVLFRLLSSSVIQQNKKNQLSCSATINPLGKKVTDR